MKSKKNEKYDSDSGYETSAHAFTKKIEDRKNQYVIFSEADSNEFLPDISDGFRNARYW